MSTFLESITSIWDSLTTSNRHADRRKARFSTPSQLPFYNTTNNPSNANLTSRPAPLTIASDRQSSWEDLPTPLRSNPSTQAIASPRNHYQQNNLPLSPPHPASPMYTPNESRKLSLGVSRTTPNLQIPLQSLSSNGVQPPAPVSDSWARIDAWCEVNYPELFDQLSNPCTAADVDALEQELGDIQLPLDVRESLYVHDGQDRGGQPTGVLFGVALLDCEEIVEEWSLWKTVAEAYVLDHPLPSVITPSSINEAGPSKEDVKKARRGTKYFGTTAQRQASRPPHMIKNVYAHPGWIPLAKDFSGNNIAVDLSPGPAGMWGQVILFGRECDVKYVVAPSWSSFLASVADDFEGGEARFVKGRWDDGYTYDDDDSDEGPLNGDGSLSRRGGSDLNIRSCEGARDTTLFEVLKARVRNREREERKRREAHKARALNGEGSIKGSPSLSTPTNGFPSPSLPRESTSAAASPISPPLLSANGGAFLSSPLVTSPSTFPSPKESPRISPVKRIDSITVNGPSLLRDEDEGKNKRNSLVYGGVVVKEGKMASGKVEKLGELTEIQSFEKEYDDAQVKMTSPIVMDETKKDEIMTTISTPITMSEGEMEEVILEEHSEDDDVFVERKDANGKA